MLALLGFGQHEHHHVVIGDAPVMNPMGAVPSARSADMAGFVIQKYDRMMATIAWIVEKSSTFSFKLVSAVSCVTRTVREVDAGSHSRRRHRHRTTVSAATRAHPPLSL